MPVSDGWPEEPERCYDCGAREDQACEEWCASNRPAPQDIPCDPGRVEEVA